MEEMQLMKSDSSSYQDFIRALGEMKILKSYSTSYQVKAFIGEGVYGNVVHCVNLRTNKAVAIKIHKNDPKGHFKKEVNMLKAIRTLDQSKCNIVRFIEDFSFVNTSCLVFEMLDKSLKDLMQSQTNKSFILHEIRPVIYQLLVALDALKSLGLMYTDLKTDNVMLVNHSEQPFRIKLIDFGLVLPEKKVKRGQIIMPATYRAPEVTLGLPVTTAIDMWGLGCLMANLYLGFSMFNSCAYNRMKDILKLVGHPVDWPLELGKMTNNYFIWENDPTHPHWRLRTPQEYEEVSGVKPQDNNLYTCFKNLNELVLSKPTDGEPEKVKDRKAFLHLLKCFLHPNAYRRITTKSAMRHNFITMGHLDDDENNLYADTASQFMSVCHQLHMEAPRAQTAKSSTATFQNASKLQFDSNTKETTCENIAKDEAADTPGPTNCGGGLLGRIFNRVCTCVREVRNTTGSFCRSRKVKPHN